LRIEIRGDGWTDLKPGKIIALGLNYADHIEETGQQTPAEPILFAKTPNVLIGSGEPIVIPAFIDGYGFENPTVHYEAEMAVVIGRRARNVAPGDALGCVMGYSCFNDVSQRNFQFSDASGWFRGKSLDTFGPLGPVIAPADGIDPDGLGISCRLNGETVQRSNTSEMLFGTAAIVSFVSRNMTLEPGDVIATGTPAGVGPLAPGDTVEVEIEGIGCLRNPVVAGSAPKGEAAECEEG
jgi:2-keto-4-pentenoate hydratase/2-oxohepta-3-ene-1,7-dioic acid hydratase in catechol pathway